MQVQKHGNLLEAIPERLLLGLELRREQKHLSYGWTLSGSLAHNGVDVSLTHKYIKKIRDQTYPAAFGKNDGVIYAGSAH